MLDLPLTAVTDLLLSRPSDAPFGYLVTPNADHLARLQEGDPKLALCYSDAEARVFDSRFLARFGRLLGAKVPHVVTGSDLTDRLLRQVGSDAPITVVGTTPASVERLRTTLGLQNVHHLCLPFGFDPDDPAICRLVIAHLSSRPARLVLFACGSPRQEILARHVALAGEAAGLGLCIGSAVDQIGGHTRRAPEWLRKIGFEWAWRLAAEPRRLAPRYWKASRALVALASLELRRRVRMGAGPSSNSGSDVPGNAR